MTDGGCPRIVATLPARRVEAVHRQVRAAARQGADIAEIRWDRFPVGEWGRRRELVGAGLPLWATYRSRAEGGEGASDPARRRTVLTALAGPPFAYLDLEYRRDLPAAAGLARRLAASDAPRTVVSLHGGSRVGDLASVVDRMGRSGDFVKVVFPADTETLLTRILPGWPRIRLDRAVIHTTGGSGAILRAGARRLGLGFVFARPGADDPSGAVEPSQLPVDRMRWWLDGPVGAPLFAVVGHPVDHSLSPSLHGRWMRASRRHGLYVAVDIGSAAGLARAVPFLAASGYRGLNVTAPLKRAAFEFADRRDRWAAVAGAANTLTFQGGRWSAANTDVTALLRRATEVLGPGGARRRWTVLGSGGAARAALAAAGIAGGPAEIRARNLSAARRLAREFGAEIGPAPGPPAEILVQATPAGAAGAGPLELSVDGLIGPGTWVLDMVYAHTPGRRLLRSRALRVGARYEDGRRLLVLQAAESFALWWGAPPPEPKLPCGRPTERP